MPRKSRKSLKIKNKIKLSLRKSKINKNKKGGMTKSSKSSKSNEFINLKILLNKNIDVQKLLDELYDFKNYEQRYNTNVSKYNYLTNNSREFINLNKLIHIVKQQQQQTNPNNLLSLNIPSYLTELAENPQNFFQNSNSINNNYNKLILALGLIIRKKI